MLLPGFGSRSTLAVAHPADRRRAIDREPDRAVGGGGDRDRHVLPLRHRILDEARARPAAGQQGSGGAGERQRAARPATAAMRRRDAGGSWHRAGPRRLVRRAGAPASGPAGAPAIISSSTKAPAPARLTGSARASRLLPSSAVRQTSAYGISE